MSDILPIDIHKNITEEPNIKMEVISPLKKQALKPIPEEEPTREITDQSEPVEDIFEKAKEEVAATQPQPDTPLTKTKPKKKRQLSQLQLDNLAKARAKSIARRKELKEGKAIEKAKIKIEKDTVREAKVQKRLEEDSIIEMKARLLKEAEDKAYANSTWDEEKITKLMEKTLDSYMLKKKKEKAQPKSFIPHKNHYPQHPQQQQQVDPRYYQPAPPQNQQPRYMNNPPQNYGSNDAVQNLFGFGS
tara:strand:- start:1639 stop:2376 length:738 start_codon:yes stop_codon:yes gene_type:complete